MPIDAKFLAALAATALVFGGGYYLAANLPERDSVASAPYVPPSVGQGDEVVAIRERGKVVRQVVTVVERVVAPGRVVTETTVSTATVPQPAKTQVVTTQVTERVPVVGWRVVTVGGGRQTVTVTRTATVVTTVASPTDERSRGDVRTVVKTVPGPTRTVTAGTVTTVATPAAGEPPRTVTNERVVTETRAVPTPAVTVTRTVSETQSARTVTVERTGPTRTVTVQQPTVIVQTVPQPVPSPPTTVTNTVTTTVVTTVTVTVPRDPGPKK